MHGITAFFGTVILISFVLALVVSLFAAKKPLASALISAGILLLLAVTFSVLDGESFSAIMIQVPIFLSAAVLGMIGGLPGAAAGSWARTKFQRKDS